MQVSLYGTRGSCPCAGSEYRKYGGNTSCVRVQVEGDDPLILDLGTGLRGLGDVLTAELRTAGRPLRATALLSHLHFDHILGLPFFAPLHDPGAVLRVYGPSQEGTTVDEILSSAVKPPFFPVHMADFGGEVSFVDVGDEDFVVGSAKVRARSVPHRGHTLGFRVEADGRSIAYVPDHQAPLDRMTITDGVRELCEGVDLLIHDGQYSEDAFVAKSGWGHSTVAYAVRVAAECGARRLLLFHHDPASTDRVVDRMTARARRHPDARRLEDVSAAREGTLVDLGRDGRD